MKNYRPLVLQKINLRLPGLCIRRLGLNRHLPEVDLLARHHHPFTQILCYLQGAGRLVADGSGHDIQPEALVLLPPRCPHSFQETAGRRPLCLVLDLDLRGKRRGVSLSRLSGTEARMIKKELSELVRIVRPDDAGCRLLVASAALRILDILLQNLKILPARPRRLPAFVRHYERLLAGYDGKLPEIGELVSKMGYQKDYLNRLFKQATGLTLREYRDAFLLRKANKLLRDDVMIRVVAERLGFSDQNYFARWFKRQTGVQPSAVRGSKVL